MTERIGMLKPYLDKYKRRFSVLDLGAGINPLLSWQISMEYDAVVVMVERDLVQYNMAEFGPHTIWLRHNFTMPDLKMLQECEYFDVVIACNFLHHFPESEYMDAAITVAAMGGEVFVQIPSIHEDERVPGFGKVINGLNDFFDCAGKCIGETVQFPQHKPRPLYRVTNRDAECVLTRTNVEAPADSAFTRIVPTYGPLIANTEKGTKEWIPAINLWNFCKFGGKLPSPLAVVDMLRKFKLPDKNHGDMVPWNFLIDGQQLHLVDGFEGWVFKDEDNMKETIRKVEECLFT